MSPLGLDPSCHLSHQPNHHHSFDQIHMSGRRNSTYPAGCQPAQTFPRPCMPERILPSGLGTLTRAKNTRSSPVESLFGLMTATSPLNVLVGKLSNFTDDSAPVFRKARSS